MEGFCKGCLIKYDDPTDLLQYTEKNRRLYIYATGLQVKRNDSFTFQLCKDCYLKMKLACTFKKQCRNSDKRYKNYLALKESGETTDFCSFLKNNDDSLMFRFPLISGSSTPAAQRARDEDNESTCTSIRNFMSDILRVDELPDTETQIIREIIEEEADVLDDSLDSHWLQDDASIDTDFRLDFSLSPFSTPRSVNNDYCLSPCKLKTDFGPDEEDLMNNLTSAEEMQALKRNETRNLKKNNQEDMLKHQLQNEAGHLTSKNKQIKSLTTIKEMIQEQLQNARSYLKCKNKDIRSLTTIEEMIQDPLHNDTSTIKSNNKEIRSLTTIEEMIPDPLQNDTSNLTSKNMQIRSLTTIEEMLQGPMQNETGDIGNKNKEIKSLTTIEEMLQAPIKNDTDNLTSDNIKQKEDFGTERIFINYYVENSDLEINKRVELMENKDCQIDRNLEEALKNDNKKEYALDDLLVTPPVHRGYSAPSTPTITNILFGDKLDIDDSYINTPEPDQCIEKYADVESDVDVEGDFFYKGPEQDCIERENEEFEIDKEQEEIKDKECEYDLVNFFCKLCNKKFKHVRALRIHFSKSHHSIIVPKKRELNEKRIHGICNHCGKSFSDHRNLIRHIKQHTENKADTKCKYCNLEFSAPSKLRMHMTTHIGKAALEPQKNRKYVCHTCGATASTAGNLAMHQRRHTKKYLYYCHCGKGYYRKTDLERHNRTHTGVKPFPCSICDLSFTRCDTLNRHMKYHSAERNFPCEHCGVAFTSLKDVNSHMKRSTTCLKIRFGSELTELVSNPDKTLLYVLKEDAAKLEMSKKNSEEIQPNAALQENDGR